MATKNIIFNFLTVDVEDWVQSTLNNDFPITDKVVKNTHKMLDLFDSFNIKGTFFILGLVAEKYPGLVRYIHDRGHEIASHGYSHIPIFKLKPKECKKDISHSISLLEDIIGVPVIGYRAPDFSITKKTIWALDILEQCGIKYDSSIFPINGKRYGIQDSKRYPYKIDGKNLIELPMTTYQLFSQNIPACGGGYLRLYPIKLTKMIMNKTNKSGKPVVMYLHPYELNITEMRRIKHKYDISFRFYVKQSLNRTTVLKKLKDVFSSFQFTRVDKGLRHIGFDCS